MGRYRITRQIGATPEHVYRAFIDPALVVDWMDGTGVVDATGPLDEPGTSYTFAVWGPWRFRTTVVRVEKPHLHEVTGVGPLGSAYRMVATLTRRDGGTQLDLLTEYTVPLAAVGRWIDRRWIDREPHTIANREVDRLVRLVTDERAVPRPKGASTAASREELDDAVERAQARLLDAELGAGDWSTRWLRWSGGETQVIEAGDGEPLLLVHGGMGNAADWAPLTARLAMGRRVIAVDRPGHGLASPFDYRGIDLWRHGIGFLAEVLDALDLPTADVAGCSMGGLWAIGLAEANPERVRHLVLVGAPAGSRGRLPAKVGALSWPVVGGLIASLVRRGTADGTRSFWKGAIVAHPERLSDELLAFETLAARRNIDSWRSLVRNGVWLGAMRDRYLVESHLRRVTVPVTFVWGELDAVATIERARELAAASPGPATVVPIPDAGHLPWIDEPDLVARGIGAALADVGSPAPGAMRQATRAPEPVAVQP
ncbi:MAG TPA: alpha/beta fold hydrolase [Candidatus Limnocylindria bacterium]